MKYLFHTFSAEVFILHIALYGINSFIKKNVGNNHFHHYATTPVSPLT